MIEAVLYYLAIGITIGGVFYRWNHPVAVGWIISAVIGWPVVVIGWLLSQEV